PAPKKTTDSHPHRSPTNTRSYPNAHTQVDNLLQGKQGRFDSYKRVASRLPQVDPDESTILEFRQACVLAPFVSACEDFWAPDPVPASFNRHATVHAAGPTQYTEANALTAIMLAVSVLRELQEGNLRCTLHI
ncbi:hypothetical protein ACWD95_43635, partial [Streptomyces sp. NPDC005069]